MTEEKRAKHAPTKAAPDRRKRPRPIASPGDWEAIALSRVARKVETLAPSENETAPDALGWEARALANLRRRLKQPGGT